MGRCQRIGQILDGRIERAKKQRCTERFFVPRRRSYRLQRSNHGCLSQGKDTEMHHPPDPQQQMDTEVQELGFDYQSAQDHGQ